MNSNSGNELLFSVQLLLSDFGDLPFTRNCPFWVPKWLIAHSGFPFWKCQPTIKTSSAAVCLFNIAHLGGTSFRNPDRSLLKPTPHTPLHLLHPFGWICLTPSLFKLAFEKRGGISHKLRLCFSRSDKSQPKRHYCGLDHLHFIIASTYYLDRTHRNGHDICATRG